MLAIIDNAGRVIAVGGDELIAPEGGRAIPVETDPLASLGADQEAYWDGTAFAVRLRVLSAEETDRRDFRDKARAALANWTSLTAAQKDALLKACVRGLLTIIG